LDRTWCDHIRGDPSWAEFLGGSHYQGTQAGADRKPSPPQQCPKQTNLPAQHLKATALKRPRFRFCRRLTDRLAH
jgi:hypothetical protein